MKISFITTVFNEEKTIKQFLSSVFSQTKSPNEIIVVDGGSNDETISSIKLSIKGKHKDLKIKILTKKGNRSVGRNEAIRHATGDVIVCSDSGNILDKNWVKHITEPFKNRNVSVVAGYYEGIAENVFQKCVIPYTLVMPDKVDPHNFLPATRSVAFTKKIWEKVGGFNEKLSHNEDYAFAKKLRDEKARIVFRKDAIVYWLPRNTLKQTYIMFLRFAYGDAEARIWRPKVVFLFIRYFLFLLLLVLSIVLHAYMFLEFFIFLLILYIIWAIAKNYRYVNDVRAFFWLPVLQFTADFAVVEGTIGGIFSLDYFKLR